MVTIVIKKVNSDYTGIFSITPNWGDGVPNLGFSITPIWGDA